MGQYKLEIVSKKKEFDPISTNLLFEIKEDLGIISIENIGYTEFFEIELNESQETVTKMSNEIFVDPITQTLTINELGIKEFDFFVEVKLLPVMTDNTAIIAVRATEDYLNRKLTESEKISFGKKYYFKGKTSDEQINLMCTGLLSNSQIEQYTVQKK